jgi:tRNA A-37 threonylcarbamoyl transferase component Bud32
LTDSLGEPVWRQRLASSPRSVVWLAEIGSAPVVVKQVVGGTDAAARFDREVTALRRAARADPPVAPAVLGTDADHQVMVLEHIASGPPPADWVVGYATALARLHAVGGTGLPRWAGPSHADVDAFLAFAARLGVHASNAVADELAALVGRLRPTGAALLHGDPCPANDLHTAGGVRFVDFEQAAAGDGIVELAYLRIGFPTCWCATAPDPARIADAEAAYRSVTGPAGDLVDACAGWLLRGDALVERAHRDGTDHLAAASERDWTWGTASARQRLLHRLGVVAELADTPLGRFCADLRQHMRAVWPRLRPLPRHRPS